MSPKGSRKGQLATEPPPPPPINVKCPKGSKFYTVGIPKHTHFIGCCRSDPNTTADGNCPDKDLAAMSFNPIDGNGAKVPPGLCVVDRDEASVKWYACSEKPNPSFLGCCAVDPCSSDSGCPAESLRAAKQKSDAPTPSLLGSGAEPSPIAIASPTASTPPTVTVTMVPTNAPKPVDDGGTSLSTGALIGIGIGGGVVLLLIGFFLYWCIHRARNRHATRQRWDAAPSSAAAAAAAPLPPQKEPLTDSQREMARCDGPLALPSDYMPTPIEPIPNPYEPHRAAPQPTAAAAAAVGATMYKKNSGYSDSTVDFMPPPSPPKPQHAVAQPFPPQAPAQTPAQAKAQHQPLPEPWPTPVSGHPHQYLAVENPETIEISPLTPVAPAKSSSRLWRNPTPHRKRDGSLAPPPEPKPPKRKSGVELPALSPYKRFSFNPMQMRFSSGGGLSARQRQEQAAAEQEAYKALQSPVKEEDIGKAITRDVPHDTHWSPVQRHPIQR